jgi:hypothetical protein
MILVKASAESEAGVLPTDEALWDRMSRYCEELARAGALLDASGLQASSKGWRVRFSGKNREITDGPFTETKELVAGYTIIQVSSREEALEWTRRHPNPAQWDGEGEIEVRQLFDLDDFQEGPGLERFRELGLPSQQ